MRNLHVHTYRSIPLYSTVVGVIIYTLENSSFVSNMCFKCFFGWSFVLFFFLMLVQKRYFIHIFPPRTHFGHLSFDDGTFAVQKIQFLGSEVYSLLTLWLLSLFSCLERLSPFQNYKQTSCLLLLLL